jgi:hypothetical protein
MLQFAAVSALLKHSRSREWAMTPAPISASVLPCSQAYAKHARTDHRVGAPTGVRRGRGIGQRHVLSCDHSENRGFFTDGAPKTRAVLRGAKAFHVLGSRSPRARESIHERWRTRDDDG